MDESDIDALSEVKIPDLIMSEHQIYTVLTHF